MALFNNTKGQGMSTNTIILLILGVVILVVMILGFTMGWQKLAPWLSSSNVDDVVTSCNAACATGAKYDFCSATKTLKDDEKNKIETSCLVLSTADEFKKYGISECEIDCNVPCTQIKVGEKSGVLVSVGTQGTYDLSSTASGIPSGQTCIIQ